MAHTIFFRAVLAAGLAAAAILAVHGSGDQDPGEGHLRRRLGAGIDHVLVAGEVDPRPRAQNPARSACVSPPRQRELLVPGLGPDERAESVQSLGRALGDVLIVDVGYNESASGYREGIDRVMGAARAQGASGVVWVLLRETRDIYRQTNTVIRAAQKRWPQLLIADWNAYSRGKPWFSSDGLHMSVIGAGALASFLRPYVLRAAA